MPEQQQQQPRKRKRYIKLCSRHVYIHICTWYSFACVIHMSPWARQEGSKVYMASWDGGIGLLVVECEISANLTWPIDQRENKRIAKLLSWSFGKRNKKGEPAAAMNNWSHIYFFIVGLFFFFWYFLILSLHLLTAPVHETTVNINRRHIQLTSLDVCIYVQYSTRQSGEKKK